MYNHNKAQQSKNRVHISWDILYVVGRYQPTGVIVVVADVLAPIFPLTTGYQIIYNHSDYDYIIVSRESLWITQQPVAFHPINKTVFEWGRQTVFVGSPIQSKNLFWMNTFTEAFVANISSSNTFINLIALMNL